DFPTANIDLGPYIRPKYGVYVITALIDGAQHNGIANIGKRPTVDGETELLEAHLFDFDGDIYGKSIDVALHAFVRPEQKFEGLEALKAQIAADAAAVREWHRHNPL
ncbi:MAG: riboflavin kinase, partial [Pseudomonadota bacterium]